MQDPFDPTPSRPAGKELATAPDATAAEGVRSDLPAPDAPMREVAHAFRMNAEALHTLKEMQADLARQVRRGDRSELVVQSTQALNETFRNLSQVQQELLRRMHVTEAKRGSGPLVPLMLLGLLVVFLGGIWVVLDQLERRGPVDPELSPAAVARRERDAWREGRNEGAAHADNEVKRLGDALDEAKSRARTLQAQIQDRTTKLADLDQARRSAEIERDEFASQVRKAQSEMMAKQLLEEEVGALKLQLDAANRVASKAEHELDLIRRKNAWLRERMADYGMGFREDDPPWRPGQPAGATPEGMRPVGPREDDVSLLTNLQLAERARAARGGAPSATTGSASDGAPDAAPPAVRSPATGVPATGSRGAAYGGDGTGMPPPAVLRGTSGAVDANTASVARVRTHLNGLLRGGDTVGGAGWRITGLHEVGADRLGGVVMVRYDASGRMVESVEAREVRIAHDRARKQVEFSFRDGARMVSGQRMQLPTVGSRVVVAEGPEADAWDASSLRVIQKR